MPRKPSTTTSSATLSDVARAAGVSIATASMVLNPTERTAKVSDERTALVKAAAEKLGYVANYHARAMHLGQAETLGFALDYGVAGQKTEDEPMGVGYFHHLTMGIETETHFVGYNLALIGFGVEERAVDRGVNQLQQRRLDALIVPAVLSSVRLNKLIGEAPDLPIVLIEHDGASGFPVVHYDEAAGVRTAVEHLAGLGHRELLWLGPDDQGLLSRAAMFDQAVRGAGVTGSRLTYPIPEPRYHRSSIINAATAALTERLRQPRTFTGIVCYNDFAAVGAYAALLLAGITIPQQMSVVGFDDFVAAYVHPRLTTVSHMLVEMGRRAAELALDMAEGPEARARLRGYRDVLVPTLVARASTGPAP
ncbi:MAG TPA: LacI family DNA-binding transcriptional regulator [Planctomycetota bacterium]|nr:LacI family DNA-binding transcriptional regulator [Planctomycetota bacterium]